MSPVHFLYLPLFLLGVIETYAQDASCYNKARQKGIDLYNAQQYADAISTWNIAKECSYVPGDHDLNSWIKKANDRISAERIAKEEAQKKAGLLRQQQAKEAQRQREESIRQEEARKQRDQAEETAWDFAKNINTTDAYQIYLNKYPPPTGKYSSEAHQRLEALKKEKEAAKKNESVISNPLLISGMVKDDKGKPLAGVSIRIKGTNQGTLTEKDGSYKLTVQPGASTLELALAGHESKNIAVGTAQTIDVVLNPVREITGKITDAYYKPLAGVSVSIDQTTFRVETDTNGIYKLTIPITITDVSFIHAYKSGYDLGRKQIGTSKTIDMLLHAEASEITGKVRDRYSGKPLSAATITATGIFTGTKLDATTNINGDYKLQFPKLDAYFLKISYPGYKTENDNNTTSPYRNFDLAPETAEIGELTGKVTNEEGKPVIGAKVTLSWKTVTDTHYARTQTDTAGYYKLKGLPIKADYLWVESPGYLTYLEKNLEIGSSKTINVVFSGVREITGKVIDRKGEPLIGANIIIVGTTSGTITDIDGTYKLMIPLNAKILRFSYRKKEKDVNIGISNIINVTLNEK